MLFRRISAALGMAGLLILPATAAQAEPTAADAAFLKAAHQVNLAEIATGQIAWKKTTDPQVKNVAAALMRDHIHLDADLYRTARVLRVHLPGSPTAEQQALADQYEAAGAASFDKLYLSTQLAGHRKVLRMIRSADITEPSIKELAERAEPVITRHVEMIRKAD
ncbi:DUF4142 domain-containing protein [Actinoplanes palleronii]|uniref:DUF4142 domain-containing protein n=1 Tax=Actinoplanes palleronii TaxID=113570 RepID=A0ABQ4BIQ9_9ACTN|nr:DUF4142 domain-containing protein [Actinoplanes palleronii]GIE70166.1 hypothetical protein Apa02nite_062740 [Actinoplanes palleronii]